MLSTSGRFQYRGRTQNTCIEKYFVKIRILTKTLYRLYRREILSNKNISMDDTNNEFTRERMSGEGTICIE